MLLGSPALLDAFDSTSRARLSENTGTILLYRGLSSILLVESRRYALGHLDNRDPPPAYRFESNKFLSGNPTQT